MGYQTLYDCSTGSSNIGIGHQSLFKNINGNDNIGIGSNSLHNNQYGDFNIGIGLDTLKSLTDGSNNIALGSESLKNNITGDFNLAIGGQSLHSNQSGKDNIGIGVRSLFNTTSQHNIGIGTDAIFNNSIGKRNIGIGSRTLYNNSLGERNIAIGFRTLEDFHPGYISIDSNVRGIGNIGIGNTISIYKNIERAIGYPYDEYPNDYIGSQDHNILIGTTITAQGYGNICIGKDLTIKNNSNGTDFSDLNYNNIIIGNNISMESVHNHIQIGNPGETYSFTVGGRNLINGTTGAKTFVIDHPNYPEKKHLVHACLEGPESGVYYRGKNEIKKDKDFVIINLPDYFDNLIVKDSETINLTHIYDGENKLYSATEINNNSFKVYGKPGKFYWIVHAKRKNTDFNIEPNKSDVNVKGDGPYKYIC